MAKLTKAAQAERDEALADLRKWIKPGDTVYTILDHVSASGMSRAIRVVVPYTREDGTIDHVHPNWAVGRVLGLRHYKRNGREQDALVVGGCGMDMGFHLVYELSYALYGKGYSCLGKGKCPSNYHNNHRDRINCPGVGTGDDHQHCYAPEGFFGRRDEIPEDWPRRVIDVGDGETIEGPPLSCIATPEDAGGVYVVCPTCAGEGRIDNPEGPERFDLVHTDGYAVRHRWL